MLRAAGLALPLLFIAIAWPGLRENSATYDETAHVPAGFTYLTRGDFRLNSEHPPLLKALFAAPLLALAPSIGSETERAFDAAPGNTDAQWIFGYRFLYRDNRPELLLFRARLVALLLAAALVGLVHRWARELFGAGGGLFAASLLALDPNFLAHGALATTDVGGALFSCATVYFARRSFRSLGAANVLATGLAAGAACLSKFAGALLIPTLLILGGLRLVRSDPWPIVGRRVARSPGQKAAPLVAFLLACGLLAWGSVWASYGFRYAASPGGPRLPIAAVVRGIREKRLSVELRERGSLLPEPRAFQQLVDATPPGLAERFITFAARHDLLPEAYLHGLALASLKTQARRTFLLGRISVTGSTAYFPLCFAVKTPAATLVVLAAAFALAAGRLFRVRPRNEAAFLLVPATVIALAAMGSKLNIGHRHILGLYPFLYVYAGSLPGELSRLLKRTVHVWASIALVLLVAAETLWARPYFIPFFNVFAGGARGGIRLLSDSNLDWGQGLPALRRWMTERAIAKVNLCYFGTADPAAYGIAFVPIVGSYRLVVPGVGEAGDRPQAPELPGYIAIGATNLQGVYFSEALRGSFEFLRRKRPVAILAGSVYVYWVDRWGD